VAGSESTDEGAGVWMRPGTEAGLEEMLAAAAEGRAEVRWYGKGAEALGLAEGTEVDPETARALLLHGIKPDGTPMDLADEKPQRPEPKSDAARIFGEWLDRHPPQ
jgi:TrwC relaxase